MDPSSVSFTPQSEIWQLSNSLRNVQEVQQDHAERLLRLERRNEEEARVKSVWGPTSPFPGVLSGTPSHGPTRHHSTLDFASFDDDHSSNMMRSLQLDAEEEPRRTGATSRANSVRFDDSANQAQVAHNPRPSLDFNSRTSSLQGMGGLPMFERTSSHKSDGRHSSTGQSAVSGRANSLGIDSAPPTVHPPAMAPGLFILGSVPSIIRCWLNTDFKSESVLYAAICTGSYKSFIDIRLVDDLGLTDQVGQDINGDNKIKLPMFLPEAVPQSSSSRTGASPQLPSFTVDFAIVDQGQLSSPKAIQCFVGSDTLRAHNADILMSTNSMTIFDDERNKWSIPLVRPESDSVFKSLSTSSVTPVSLKNRSSRSSRSASVPRPVQPGEDVEPDQTSFSTANEAHVPESESGAHPVTTSAAAHPPPETKPSTRVIQERKPSLSLSISRNEARDASEPQSATLRSTTSPAIWNNWRRDGGSSGALQGDWANVSRSSSSTYQRPTRDGGIKVLKPSRQMSRSSIGPSAVSSPSVANQPRAFDEMKHRNGGGSDSGESASQSRKTSGEMSKPSGKENSATTAPAGKPRSANPIGGASAFGWLNAGGK